VEKIIIIGGGGHAKVIIAIIKKAKKFNIIGYTDINDYGKILGAPYLGNDEVLSSLFNDGINNAVIGIGQIKSSAIRRGVSSKLKKIGFEFPVIVSPTAVINEDVVIGEGTVVMDGVVINPGTKIGSFSIINTRASIDHDCVIGNFTHIAPGVTLSGDVKIGDSVLIGTGASVVQSRRIVDNSIVAAGSAVTSYILTPGTYIGIPARLMPTKEDFKNKKQNG